MFPLNCRKSCFINNSFPLLCSRSLAQKYDKLVHLIEISEAKLSFIRAFRMKYVKGVRSVISSQGKLRKSALFTREIMLVPSSDIRKEGCNLFSFCAFLFPCWSCMYITSCYSKGYGIGTCTRELLESLDIEIWNVFRICRVIVSPPKLTGSVCLMGLLEKG